MALKIALMSVIQSIMYMITFAYFYDKKIKLLPWVVLIVTVLITDWLHSDFYKIILEYFIIGGFFNYYYGFFRHEGNFFMAIYIVFGFMVDAILILVTKNVAIDFILYNEYFYIAFMIMCIESTLIYFLFYKMKKRNMIDE